MKTIHARLIGSLDALILVLAGGLKLALLLTLFGVASGEPPVRAEGQAVAEGVTPWAMSARA